MKIIAIECDDGRFFISGEDKYRSYSELGCLFMNGLQPEESFCKDWFIIKSKPLKIERKVSQLSVNHRFELIDKTMKSEKIPLIFKKEDVIDKDSEYGDWKKEYSTLQSLYKANSDKQPDKFENIEFDFEILLKFF